MAACEKCWRDANLRALTMGGSVTEHYHALLDERRDNTCAPDAVTDASGRYLAPPQPTVPVRPSGPWDGNERRRA